MNNILFLTKVNEKYMQELKNENTNFDIFYAQDYDDALKYVNDTEIIVSFDSDFNSDLLEKANKLKWIHLLSAGADTLPFNLLKKKKILLTNSKDIHKHQISQQVLGYMLMIERSLDKFLRKQINKEWDRSVQVSELTEKSALIIGAGSIGEEIARLLKEFGMKTYGIRNSGKPSVYIDKMYSSIENCDVIADVDYVIAILPLTKNTYHLIGKNVFDTMKKSAFFINVGRGKTVDETVLIEALKKGNIKGAALDVFEEEPLSIESPLWEMENVIITPHVAGITPLYMKRAIEVLKKNLDFYVNGKPLINKINLDKEY